MPDTARPQYLITIQRMMRSDEADVVSGWSGVIDEQDLLTNGREGKLLAIAIEATGLALQGYPGKNLRPMTDDEIKTWRQNN